MLFKQFLKYSLVGCLGVLLELGTVWFSVEFLYFHYRTAVVLAFIVSVSIAFLINRTWTFSSDSEEKIKQYLKYFFVALGVVTANVFLISISVEVFGLWYLLSQAISSPCLGIFAFLVNRRWTFGIK